MKKEILSIMFLLSLSLGLLYYLPDFIVEDYMETNEIENLAGNIEKNKQSNNLIVDKNTQLTFDIIRVSPDGDTVMAGQSEPDVHIYLYENKKEISSFFADPNGEWIWISDDPLTQGVKVFTIKFRDRDGEEHWSNQEIYILDDKSSKLKPKVVKISSNNFDDIDVYNQDYIDNGITLDLLSYKPGKKFTISGRAPSNTILNLFSNELFIAKIKSDFNGHWKYSSELNRKLSSNLNITSKIDGKDLSIVIPLDIIFVDRDLKFNDSVMVEMDTKGTWKITRKINENEYVFSEIFNDNLKIAAFNKKHTLDETFKLVTSR